MAYPSIWFSVAPEAGNNRQVACRLYDGSTLLAGRRAWTLFFAPASGAVPPEPSGFLMGTANGVLVTSFVANKFGVFIGPESGTLIMNVTRIGADTTWFNAMCEGVWNECSVAFV